MIKPQLRRFVGTEVIPIERARTLVVCPYSSHSSIAFTPDFPIEKFWRDQGSWRGIS